MIQEFKQCGPFVIALYSGTSKPSSLDEYLQPFISELKSLLIHGIEIYKQVVRLKLEVLVCDSPARSFLKGIKGHTGYNSCERCMQHGEWNGRLIFADHATQPRTDQAFKLMLDEGHHQIVSPLTQLDFGMVSRFVLDHMHLVYLGIVRKNIFLWLLGPLKTRLPSQVIAAISKSLVLLAPHVSRDFSRKPRPLAEVKMWKATEFHQFLLYTGLFVLYKKLSSKMFHNFVLLSVAMRLLLSSNKGPFTFSYVQQQIEIFVKNFAKIYSSQVLTYNVHSLLHIVDDAKFFGSLDNISCFPFENYLCTLKQLISKHQQKNPIPQIIRHLEEKNLANASTNLESDEIVNCCRQQHYEGPLLQGFETFNQFK